MARWLALVVLLAAGAAPAAEVSLLSPAGGESWSAGSLHHVAWKAVGLAAGAVVQAEWSADGGKTWSPAGKAAASAGKLLWKVPDKLTSEGMVRLAVAGGPTASSKAFAVTASKAKAYRWVNVTMKAPFAPRDGAGALTFQKKMWFLGGWNPSDKKHFPRICNNEVWSSSDGKDWTLVKPNTFLDRKFDSTKDWEGRHTAGYAVFKDRMWIVGGDCNQGHYHGDVWSSADGKDWTLVSKGKTPPWHPRCLHYTVAFKDKLWVIGGQTVPQFAKADEAFHRDVWTSSDGVAWEQVKPKEPCWPQRGMIGGAVVFDGRIWILGGGTYDTAKIPKRKYFQDVWSTADGVEWKQHADAPWEPRQYHDVAVFDGRMWVMEGYNEKGGNRKDVWHSADGVNWHEIPATPWKPRHAASVFVHDDALWMVAGNNMESDVWKLVPDTAK